MVRIRHVWIFVPLFLMLASPAVGADGRPDYSYIEVNGDISKTANDARGATDDAHGRLIGVAASWQVHDLWYAAARHTVERKTFRNEALGRELTLGTRQTVSSAAGGRIWHAGGNTDIYFEAMAVHTRVDHDVPHVRVVGGVPRTIGIRVAVIEDTGLGAAVGLRNVLSEAVELEGRLESVDVAGQTETKLVLGARRELADAVAAGLHVSYSTSTDHNFDDILKIGASLRYDF